MKKTRGVGPQFMQVHLSVDFKWSIKDTGVCSQVRRTQMEIIFYVGMIGFGLYCLVNEDIEDVRKDFPWMEK